MKVQNRLLKRTHLSAGNDTATNLGLVFGVTALFR